MIKLLLLLAIPFLGIRYSAGVPERVVSAKLAAGHGADRYLSKHDISSGAWTWARISSEQRNAQRNRKQFRSREHPYRYTRRESGVIEVDCEEYYSEDVIAVIKKIKRANQISPCSSARRENIPTMNSGARTNHDNHARESDHKSKLTHTYGERPTADYRRGSSSSLLDVKAVNIQTAEPQDIHRNKFRPDKTTNQFWIEHRSLGIEHILARGSNFFLAIVVISVLLLFVILTTGTKRVRKLSGHPE